MCGPAGCVAAPVPTAATPAPLARLIGERIVAGVLVDALSILRLIASKRPTIQAFPDEASRTSFINSLLVVMGMPRSVGEVAPAPSSAYRSPFR